MSAPTPYEYPTGTTPEAIEAFRTIWCQTPEDDIRLGSVFEIFLKGFVAGQISAIQYLSCNEFVEYDYSSGKNGNYTRQ
jgi:hypothetical protein